MKRFVFLSLALVACDKPTSETFSAPSAVPPPLSPVATASTPNAPAQPPYTRGPPANGASREEREKAALDLLSGRAHAADLPLADVEPGETFEPNLRQAIGASTYADIQFSAVTATDLDEDEIHKAIARQKSPFMICYSTGLRHNPNLRGLLAARIVVTTAGKPLLVEDGGSDLQEDPVVACALEAIRKINFPAPRGPEGIAMVSLEFVLR